MANKPLVTGTNGHPAQHEMTNRDVKISDYAPQRILHGVIEETDIDAVDDDFYKSAPVGDESSDAQEEKEIAKVKKNVVFIEVSTERKTPTRNVVELFDAKTDGTLIF